MALVGRGICKITALNSNALGTGISDTQNELIEIPYTIPGEIVEFEKHLYRDKISYNVSQILESSDHRTSPPCKYFTICGGCSLQHVEVDYYYQYKQENLEKILNKYKINCKISSTETIGFFSRRRVIFETVKKHDNVFLGFKKFHSDKIVNINECLIIIPELSNLIPGLKEILFEFLEDKEKCKLLITKAENGIDFTIETNKEISSKQSDNLKNFAINNKIIRLTIIDKNRWHLIYFAEQPYALFEDIKVAIDNHSFLQVSKLSDNILIKLINNIFREKLIRNSVDSDNLSSIITADNEINKHKSNIAPLQIVDLFCGRGTLTIPASKFGIIDGFESEKSSVKALKEAVNNAGLEAKIFQRDLFISPLQWDELNKYDVAILNPPRAGAKAQAIILEKSTVKTIIYLSCNPESFARDAEIILKNNRYELENITPIDQFYWTHHLEILALFTLR